ncbi:DUF4178 domain-containing protein [Nostoc sp. 3335mG]|nr:DUF4178 domain-containing protein [Nostoc sp. 3335mG]
MQPETPVSDAQPAGPRLEPSPSATVLTCPSCGGSVKLRAAGFSVTVCCEYCGSLLDVTNPTVKLLVEDHRARAELAIPLGTRGTLRGIEWEVVGYLRRSERGAYGWEEYLLFNPYRGYRWLIANRGSWSLGEMRTDAPSGSSGTIRIDGDSYEPFFASGTAQVDYVLGEFYWRVAKGETVSTDDWARPGFMLSREKNAHEISWTLSEWLEPDEMKAFGVTPPKRIWPPLPHQPSPHRAWLKRGWKVALAAIVGLFFAMTVFGGSRELVDQTLSIPRTGAEASSTIGPITLNRPYQKVEIRADVPALENGWVDLDYRLVNRATQQSYQAYGAAERYSGRDSDGSWSEGSRDKEVSVASVPAGTYDLVVEYKGNRWTDPNARNGVSLSVTGIGSWDSRGSDDGGWMASAADPQLRVRVSQGALFFGNFIIALLLIGIPLIWVALRHLSFETSRRSQSDFAGGDDEDDD